ncbi:MAG TPA: hypothetical protein VHV54_10830, partial [Candidatus Binatia bacterium]|nr:hypothetical protein [Candidatus Binatia bacterium]
TVVRSSKLLEHPVRDASAAQGQHLYRDGFAIERIDHRQGERQLSPSAVWDQAIRSKKITSEKTLSTLLNSTLIVSPNTDVDQAPKKTKTRAAMTNVAQKRPIPAITQSSCIALGGGTSGIRIFLALDLSVMKSSDQHLRCQTRELRGAEAIYALR